MTASVVPAYCVSRMNPATSLKELPQPTMLTTLVLGRPRAVAVV